MHLVVANISINLIHTLNYFKEFLKVDNKLFDELRHEKY